MLFVAAAGFRFASPWWLLALAAIPAALWLRRRARVEVLVVPFASAWHRAAGLKPARWPAALMGAGLVLVVLALARPQLTQVHRQARHEGYDIMLCIDLSSSMLSEDYVRDGRPLNRLDAIRPVVRAFIDQRPDDRIGVVLFSHQAYTLAPLTLDHDWLARQLERVHIGLIEDGTAIGDGLGVALSRLEQGARQEGGRRRGAFIVLMTDGANNCGALSPMQAAAIAKARGIPIYTIGAGRDGFVTVPIYDNGRRVSETHQLSDLDEDALRDIASETGGRFFRAAETGTIESAFAAIDRTRKIEFQARTYLTTAELFAWLAAAGALLIAASESEAWL